MTEEQTQEVGLTTEQSQVRGAILLKVTGYIDLSTAPLMEKAVSEVVEQSPEVLIIDLTAVDFLGSGGLSILAKAHSRLVPSAKLVVVANEIALRPIQITGLDQVFDVHESVDSVFAGS